MPRVGRVHGAGGLADIGGVMYPPTQTTRNIRSSLALCPVPWQRLAGTFMAPKAQGAGGGGGTGSGSRGGWDAGLGVGCHQAASSPQLTPLHYI